MRSAPASRYSRWTRRRGPGGSSRARRGRRAAGCRARTAACPSRRRRAAGRRRGGRRSGRGAGSRGKPSRSRRRERIARAAGRASACRRPRAGPAAGAGGRCRSSPSRRRTRRPRAIATRSPRRSGGRSWTSRVSVLSQIGPSTRAVASRSPRRRVATGVVERPAERGQRDDRVVRAVQRRADELGHAGVEDDDALRVRPLADVEHATPTSQPAPRDEEPAGLDGQARRAAGRAAARRAAAATSRAKRAGVGTVPGSPTGKPPPTSNVSKPAPARADEREQREARGGRRRATRRPRPAASRRGGGCRARGAARPPGSRGDGARQLGLGHAELRACRGRRRGPRGSRASTSGLRRSRTSSGGRPVRPSPARGAIASERVELLGALDGDPAQRVAVGRGPDRRPEVGGGLADALERDPVVGDARPRRGRGPLAARDDVRAEARAAPSRAMIAGTSFALTREGAQPRVGERGARAPPRPRRGRRPT